jgi:hypothetical protein
VTSANQSLQRRSSIVKYNRSAPAAKSVLLDGRAESSNRTSSLGDPPPTGTDQIDARPRSSWLLK